MYYCQYKKFLFWRNFKDRTLNKRSNLNVCYSTFTDAELWLYENN